MDCTYNFYISCMRLSWGEEENSDFETSKYTDSGIRIHNCIRDPYSSCSFDMYGDRTNIILEVFYPDVCSLHTMN